MSILNLGLLNCATARKTCDEEIEQKLKNCNSMDALRDLKDPNIKKSWLASVQPVQKIIEDRFECLKLKGQQMKCNEPVTVSS